MGIGGFYTYFLSESNTLKSDKKFITEEIIDQIVKRLYVDFVSIVYDILLENKDLDNGADESDPLIIQKIIERLAKMFSHYPNAKKLIFFECIPTVAKIKEQYARRIFKKIQSDIELDLKKKLNCKIEPRFDPMKFGIDSNFIKSIIDAINENFNDAEVFSYANNDVGEAEHRIIYHIANTEFKDGDVFIISSPDADIFLLATILTNLLSSKNKTLTINALRRSDDVSNRLFYKIDIEKYMNYLLLKVKNNYGKNKYDTINDITYIFNLLGDDFIPIFDKFKTSQAKDIFPLIFTAIKNLGSDCVLENINNKLIVNKLNLLKVFEELYKNIQPLNDYKHTYKYILPTNAQLPHNKLVFMVLQDAFQKGYYFYEKSLKSNHNNFFVTNLNYNKQFNNTTSKFLVYNINNEKNQYEITINQSYKTVSMVEIDKNKHSETNKIDQIKNYFEGFEFILDLYYNTIGTVKNKFWYYKYNKSPSIGTTIDWLKQNDMPSYVKSNLPTKYFTKKQYSRYLMKLVNVNYSMILNKSSNKLKQLAYDDLVKINGAFEGVPLNKIFDCFEKKYINKCEIKGEKFFDPIDFVVNWPNSGKSKKLIKESNKKNGFYKGYKKYKKKYLKLKNKTN